ncbi:hypothetical protein M9H77_14384 [Catharanthus roseus]|uniref:Uncharacterized protein n=1 Tax=Catharanthus roseus TaxID=4058 RepID=A0ACC0BMY4_CATRO|nr:hypothetical protein M9H77_14384 [Catharanthus roseus]
MGGEILGIYCLFPCSVKVNRIVAKSERFDMYMQLDINTDIYPMRKGEKFLMELAPTLNLDGTPDTGYFTQESLCPLVFPVVRQNLIMLLLEGEQNNAYFSTDCEVSVLYIPGNRKSLADKYEYVMHGKLYKITEDKRTGKADILASFGGLLMWMKGDRTVAAKFELDQRLFILIRKMLLVSAAKTNGTVVTGLMTRLV